MMIAGQLVTSNEEHTLKEVVTLSVLLGLGKPNDFVIDEPSSGGNLPALSNDGGGSEDLMEDNWGPILEAVTIEEENRDEEQASVMVSIELLDDEDEPDNNLPDVPELVNHSTDTSDKTAGTNAEATTSRLEKRCKPGGQSFLVCKCPKSSSSRKGKQNATCKLCQQQSKKEESREEEVLGVKDGRWRGPRFPCNQCKYVACREVNLINHKASKHEGVMFMDSYISDYFAKNKLVFI